MEAGVVRGQGGGQEDAGAIGGETTLGRGAAPVHVDQVKHAQALQVVHLLSAHIEDHQHPPTKHEEIQGTPSLITPSN